MCRKFMKDLVGIGRDRTMMVVPNEFRDSPRKSDIDAGDLWRNAVMQDACIPRGLQGREMQGTKRQRE